MLNPREVIPLEGVLRSELFIGVISAITAAQARVNLSVAGAPTASHFEAHRYGRGEVGELVLIEGQRHLVLGRVVEVRLPEIERRALAPERVASRPGDVIGTVQFLGTVRTDNLRVGPGVDTYPRLGDRVYAAPHRFVSRIPELMESARPDDEAISLSIGMVGGADGGEVTVRPERLFGRHCAILGSTGGGKSWTIAKLLEGCVAHRAKLILLDATGEYRALSEGVSHVRLGDTLHVDDPAKERSLPADCFHESDFIALFQPSGKVQGPKLREAIRSLKMIRQEPSLSAQNGYLLKVKREKAPFWSVQKQLAENGRLDDPRMPFDVLKLSHQLMEECVFADGGTKDKPDPLCWGNYSLQDKAYCASLAARIVDITHSDSFAPVFQSKEESLDESMTAFLESTDERLLRVSLAGVSYEYRAREVMVNAIGRTLLTKARSGKFRNSPLVVLVDEAHNFLGRDLGYEETSTRLDAFELIAREGRKYGLNLCLATQRPRDLTEGVLSQMGTLIVHRLTNDRDRDIVERACGEIDRSASAFLPNLKPGEAAIIGVDFPIPMTVQIEPPQTPPHSDGPDYQRAWKQREDYEVSADAKEGSEATPPSLR